MDLWKLVAAEHEHMHGASKGKMQMAGQTRAALQQIACTVVAITSSKPAEWHPFQKPHALSEVHIEQHFGQLRSQYPSGDLTVRGYWNAAARKARTLVQKKPAKNVEYEPEPPLTQEQLLGSIRAISVFFLLLHII